MADRVLIEWLTYEVGKVLCGPYCAPFVPVRLIEPTPVIPIGPQREAAEDKEPDTDPLPKRQFCYFCGKHTPCRFHEWQP